MVRGTLAIPAYLQPIPENSELTELQTPPTSLRGPATLDTIVASASPVGDGQNDDPPLNINSQAQCPSSSTHAPSSNPTAPIPSNTTPTPLNVAATTSSGTVSAIAPTPSNTTPSTAPERRRQKPRQIGRYAPRDRDNRFLVELSSNHKIIQNHVASVVSGIFEEYPHEEAYNYEKIPQDVLNRYWEEFQCYWDTCYSNQAMKNAFTDKLRDRYADILNKHRKSGKQPSWCPDNVWESWRRCWQSPEFVKKSERQKKIRAGKEGKAIGTHNGGSVAHAMLAKKIEKQIGKAPDPHKLFLWTHTMNHDGVNFVNNRARTVQEQFTLYLERFNELESFWRASGGMTRERTVYGLGTASNEYYSANLSHRRSHEVGESSSSLATASPSTPGDWRPMFEELARRCDHFDAERGQFLERLDRAVEQMQRPPQSQSNDGLHLHSGEAQVRELRDRVRDVETTMVLHMQDLRNSFEKLQTTVDGLQQHITPIP